MNRIMIFILAAKALAWVDTAIAGAQDAPSPISRTAEEQCHINGIERWVYCARVTVPVDWNAPGNGEALDLFYARIPAIRPGGAPPLFVLPGGPGQAASDMGGLAAMALSRINESRDIILLDSRGTGRSHPLQCPEAEAEILEWSAEQAAAEGARCLAAQQVDVRLFTSWSIIRDLEAVRRALGHEQITLWGESFGTRTALLYINTFPGRAEAAILDSVTRPEDPIFEAAPAHAQAAFQAMLAACRAETACNSTFPDLEADVQTLFARFSDGPLATSFRDPLTGDPFTGRLARLQLAEAVRSSLYSTNITAYLPAALSAAASGEYEPIAATASILQQGIAEGMDLGLTLAILCSEDLPRTSQERLTREAQNSFHGDSYYRFWQAYCTDWPVGRVDGTDTGPENTDTRLLLLSGGLDPVTPPANAVAVLRDNPHAIHAVAPQASHIVSTVPCAGRLMADFLDGAGPDALDTVCLARRERPPFYIPMHRLQGDRP